MFRVFTTKEFDRSFGKLSSFLQSMIDNEIEQLKTNPYVGKPLGYKFFREKKIENYRFYYLIYKKQIIVFLVAISDKKDQQKTIDKIKKLIPYYKKEIEKRFST